MPAGPAACQAVGNRWLTVSPQLPSSGLRKPPPPTRWLCTGTQAAGPQQQNQRGETGASGGPWQAVGLEYQFLPGRAYVDQDPSPQQVAM